MSLITPRTLKGFRDLMPDQALRRSRMLRTLEDTFRAHGYGPIDTPVLEFAEILKGKGGGDTDKELYEFVDKGGREVALRFDLTVPLARYVSEHQGKLVFPFRRYHTGLAWRGERPQRGRYREFMTCDADLVGVTGIAADAEIIAVMAAVYRALEVGSFTIRMNDRRVLTGLLDGLGATEVAPAVLRALDKREKQGPEVVLEEMKDAGLTERDARWLLQATVAKEDDDATLTALASAAGGSPSGQEGVDALAQVRRLAFASGTKPENVKIDPTIARGLDYYTGIVYEVALNDAPGFGSVGSGGRYDDLAGLYTQTRLPGVGGSVGVDRLLAALEAGGTTTDGPTAAEAMVIHPGAETLEEALRFAADLRGRGHAVEVYPEERKHKAQMRYADKRGIRFVFTPDPDGSFQGKDLSSGDTLNVPNAARAAEAISRRVG